MNIKSQHLKTEALAWLRFAKKMDFVCTEGGRWSSDVLGVCDNYSIEVETKISRADLLAEFRNKKFKHAAYKRASNWTPNYFYFLVPSELAEGAAEVIEEKFPEAGLISYRYVGFRLGDRLELIKKAKRLHPRKPTADMRRSVLLRMGSELCGLHEALDQLKHGEEITSVESMKEGIINAIIGSHGAQDWEKDDEEAGTGAGEGGGGLPSPPGDSGERPLSGGDAGEPKPPVRDVADHSE